MEQVMGGLAGVLVLGIGAQWLAWRLHLPSILLLILFGFLAGPVAGWIRPDELLGELLFPLVSISVSVILFEGGLTLRLRDLRQIGSVVRNLLTVGVLVTWGVGAAAAALLLPLETGPAVLLGAILVVTGPTVMGPLLRHLRLTGPVEKVARWEGIVIDAVGAILAVLVFEAILSGSSRGSATLLILAGLGRTLLVGAVAGAVLAWILVEAIRRHWIPDYLHSPAALALVVAGSVLSSELQTESGLLTATVMGIVLANQPHAPVRHILHFKENLQVILISSLFILLAARLRLEDLARIPAGMIAFLAVLLLVARPLSVLVATWRSDLSRRERILLAWLAPRGIVAAAVASVFALRLAETHPSARLLAPLVFLTIVGTVVIYGLTAPLLARWLRLSDPDPQGALIVGANPVAVALGSALQEAGVRVLLVDSNWDNNTTARMAGLPTHFANILSEYARDELPLAGMGRLLALTPNDEVNSLAALHFLDRFGRREVYQLAPAHAGEHQRRLLSPALRGRRLFGPDASYAQLASRLEEGWVTKTASLSEGYDYEAFRERYGPGAIPLFLRKTSGRVLPFTVQDPPRPESEDTLIALVEEKEQEERS